VELTIEMQENMRRHYRAQGATGVDLIQSESAALVPTVEPINVGVSWRRWKSANGFIATCNQCHQRGEFEEVTKAGKKTLRFRHCGNKVEKLPLLLRWLF
jgi:hypothetical protein